MSAKRAVSGKRVLSGTARIVITVVLVVVTIFPLYWMVNTAVLPTSAMFQKTPRMFPQFDDLGSHTNVFTALPIVSWLSNSLVIAVGTTVLSLLIALFAAYALSRYRFRGKGLLGFALFATQMLPEAMLLVPLYILFLSLGLLNNLAGLVLVDTVFVMPIVVWILKGAIDSIPLEIEEAARVDGSSRLTVQTTIVWPLILPSIAASSVLAFFYAWNEYLLANTFILNDAQQPASVGLASLIGELTTPMDTVMSGALIYTLPALVFFLLVQRHIVSGLTAGSVKG
jgi:multiple sugar transport system permease protein